MASVFTHAAIPLLTGRRLGLPRRVLWVGAALGCAADLDLLGYAFDVHTLDPWGHRGLSHSLLLGAAAGLLAALLLLRRTGALRFAPLAGFLCFCAMSHGLIDALTFGETGVALFAPLSPARLLTGLHLAPVFPLGANEALGRTGRIVLLDELLFLVTPWALLLWASAAWRGPRRRLAAAAVVAWASLFVSLRHQLPEVFGPPVARVVTASSPVDRALIPRTGLPEATLVTRLDALKSLGLFDRRLVPVQSPWSSEFFAAWFGGQAGRWRDSNLTLLWRTLFGFDPPAPAELSALLARADSGDARAREAVAGLSPTEKYDLALGDDSLAATRAALRDTHNARPRPRFWFGSCDGAAAAALARPEPWREVEVTSPLGHRIVFHPNDVKALLSVAYLCTDEKNAMGGLCTASGIDPGRACSMNPAELVLTALNRLGLAHQSFLVDVHPSLQTQFFAVAAAEISLGAEHPVDAPLDAALQGKVARLIDFEARFELSSTTLPARAADVPLEGGGGRYQKVGVRPVHFAWTGALALGADSEILGGRWTGDPADGPDAVVFVSGPPCLTDAGTLAISPTLRPEPIERLAELSASEVPGRLQLSAAELSAAATPADAGPAPEAAQGAASLPADGGLARDAGE